MTERNYNKLRPYDLTQAKVGDIVLTSSPEEQAQVVALSKKSAVLLWEDDSFGIYEFCWANHALRQQPLAWLGPDPVYAGDTLWIVNTASRYLGNAHVVQHVDGPYLHSAAEALTMLDKNGNINTDLWSLTKPEPKPRFIEINGHKVPEPERRALKHGTKYFLPDVYAATLFDSYTYTWNNDSTDIRWLKQGLVHLTKEAAIAHAKALLSFTEEHPK